MISAGSLVNLQAVPILRLTGNQSKSMANREPPGQGRYPWAERESRATQAALSSCFTRLIDLRNCVTD